VFYLSAIAEAYDVEYQADPQVMAAYARQNAIKEEDLININPGNNFMPQPPNNFPGSNPPPSNPGGSGSSYPGPGPNNMHPQPPYNPQNQQKPAFTYPSQPSQPIDHGHDQFDPMPTPKNFVAPSEPAPQPPSNMQNSSAPLHGEIYDDALNLNQGQNYEHQQSVDQASDLYQAPSLAPTSNQNNRNAKSKEAEQQYTGGQSANVQPPPSYNGYNAFPNNQQPRQFSNEDDFDIDALMPSIPTGFKGNNNDDDNKGGNAGGGDDGFDDLEARFANLKK
jgi:hypothetical protein